MSAIPELPREILNFEGPRFCYKFSCNGPPQAIPWAPDGHNRGYDSPWGYIADTKNLASKIIRGPAGAYGKLFINMAVNDNGLLDGSPPNINFNGNIVGDVYVYAVFEADFNYGAPDDAIDIEEIMNDLTDAEVNGGPYWGRRWCYANNGGLKLPDDLINRAAQEMAFHLLFTCNPLHRAMNEFIRDMVTDYGKFMKARGLARPPMELAQWVYDKMHHPHVERLIIYSSGMSVAAGLTPRERPECLPRSVEGAIEIVNAVKSELQRFARMEHGIEVQLDIDCEHLRDFRGPWVDPLFTKDDAAAFYATVFRRLQNDVHSSEGPPPPPPPPPPGTLSTVVSALSNLVLAAPPPRVPGLPPPTREPTMDELRAMHDAREAAEAAAKAAAEAKVRKQKAEARLARLQQPDKPYTAYRKPPSSSKSNKKRGKPRSTADELEHQVHTSEGQKAFRREHAEMQKVVAQAEAAERRALEKAEALRKISDDVDKNYRAASHYVPPPASIGAVLDASLAQA